MWLGEIFLLRSYALVKIDYTDFIISTMKRNKKKKISKRRKTKEENVFPFFSTQF